MAKLPKKNLDGTTRDNMDAIASKYQPQIDKFKDAARELETDNDESRFNERLKKIAKSPPSEKKPEKDKPAK